MAKKIPAIPKSNTELASLFFGSTTDIMVPKNSLYDQILNMNTQTIHLRLLRQILELRACTDSNISSYWANTLIRQLIAARLLEFRKLTEPHNPTDKPTRYTISFSHLLYELSLQNCSDMVSKTITYLQHFIDEEHQTMKYLIDKFIVHAATPDSRNIAVAQKVDISIAEIWQKVLHLNHVYKKVHWLTQAEQGECLLVSTLTETPSELRRCFLLSTDECTVVLARYTESIDELNAIQSGNAPAPWATATP